MFNPQPERIFRGGEELTVKRVIANVAASQTQQLVAAVAGKKLVVLQLALLTGATATTAKLVSSGGSDTDITMLFANAANGGAVLPFSEIGWCATLAGEALKIVTGAGAATGVMLTYVEVA